MVLVKLICQELKKPVHEVMSWPADELNYWEAFISIDMKGDKPIVKRPVQSQQEQLDALDKILR